MNIKQGYVELKCQAIQTRSVVANLSTDVAGVHFADLEPLAARRDHGAWSLHIWIFIAARSKSTSQPTSTG